MNWADAFAIVGCFAAIVAILRITVKNPPAMVEPSSQEPTWVWSETLPDPDIGDLCRSCRVGRYRFTPDGECFCLDSVCWAHEHGFLQCDECSEEVRQGRGERG